MALSDSCWDTIGTLSRDLTRYADLGYDPSHAANIIDAVFSLATFAIEQDVAPYKHLVNSRLGVSRCVVESLLGVAAAEDNIGKSITPALKLLANVSKIHLELKQSFDDVYSEVSSTPGHFMLRTNPNLLSQLEVIRQCQ
jgi:hypothetical protein